MSYISQPWYKYRVYSENYARSEVGKFVASNGVIRTIVELSKFYKIHFAGFRYIHKLPTNLVVHHSEIGYEQYRRQVYNLIKKVFKNYGVSSESNIYYEALLNFYERKSNVKLDIEDKLIKEAPLLFGKDVNIFYNMLLSNNLPRLYKILLETAFKGGFEIVVNKEYEKKINLILKFLNLSVPVSTKGGY